MEKNLTKRSLSLLLALWVVAITLWSGIDYFVKNGSCLKQTK